MVDVFIGACRSNDLALIVNILADSDLHFLLNVRDPVSTEQPSTCTRLLSLAALHKPTRHVASRLNSADGEEDMARTGLHYAVAQGNDDLVSYLLRFPNIQINLADGVRSPQEGVATGERARSVFV